MTNPTLTAFAEEAIRCLSVGQSPEAELPTADALLTAVAGAFGPVDEILEEMEEALDAKLAGIPVNEILRKAPEPGDMEQVYGVPVEAEDFVNELFCAAFNWDGQ